MAFLDNPTIILAHIRQSHVTSDDTGMCEMVLIDHDVDLEKFNPSSACGDNGAEPQGSNGDTQGYVYSQSVDITSSWDFGIRRRSNTAQRLERLRKERQNQIKCKNVQWKDRNTSCSAEELSSLFEKKNFRVKSPCSGKQSILSVRLEQCPLQLNNPFNEYSKFDGKSEESVSKNKELVLYPGWIVLLQLPGSSRASGPSHLSEQDHALKYISSPWDGVCTWQSAVNTSRPASGCFGGGFSPPGEGKGGSSPVAQKGVEPRGPGAFQSRAGLEELSCAWLCLRLRAARAL